MPSRVRLRYRAGAPKSRSSARSLRASGDELPLARFGAKVVCRAVAVQAARARAVDLHSTLGIDDFVGGFFHAAFRIQQEGSGSAPAFARLHAGADLYPVALVPARLDFAHFVLS